MELEPFTQLSRCCKTKRKELHCSNCGECFVCNPRVTCDTCMMYTGKDYLVCENCGICETCLSRGSIDE